MQQANTAVKYTTSVDITCYKRIQSIIQNHIDMSAVNLLDSREQRYIKAINNNNFVPTGSSGRMPNHSVDTDTLPQTDFYSFITCRLQISGCTWQPLRWISRRGYSRTTETIILTDSLSLLQKVKSEMRSPDWNVSIVDIHLRKLLWVVLLWDGVERI